MSTNVSRRQFLTSAGSAMAVVGSMSNAWSTERDKRVVLVDTHLHCFAGEGDKRFPYHERAPYRPKVAATLEHLLKCMQQAGVDFAIVVHPEPYQDDHRYLEHCLDVGTGKLKGTILLFADRPGSIDQLPKLAKRGDIVAARVHAYAPDRLPPFGKPELRELWRLATEHGLAMQLHFEPRYAPGFEPLIKEFSETRVIIDHLGRPFQGTPKEHEVVVRWSRFKNTVMKLSSLPSTTSYPHRDVRPVVKQLTEAFGASRMIYGGGFGATATGESYKEAFDRARSFMDHLSTPEQDRILGGNAAELFGFES